MKKTLRITALVMSVLMMVSVMVACGDKTADNTPDTTAEIAQVTEIPEVTIDETQALAIALEDAGVPETAAENLSITIEAGSYIVYFEWSGFEYEYTINGATGEITQEMFDGEVM